MAVRIGILSGGNGGQSFDIVHPEITIGRGSECTVRLHADDSICASDVHARLQCERDIWTLRVEHRNGMAVIVPGAPSDYLEAGTTRVLPGQCELVIGRSGPRIGFSASEERANAAGARAVQIRILTGHNSPWTSSFDQDVITIGRSPSADVRLHPQRDATVASDIHARLLRRPDGWRLEAVHRSGVAVQRGAGASQLVAPGQSFALSQEIDIALGSGGPRLRLTPPSATASDIPLTCDGTNSVDGGLVIGGVDIERAQAPSRRRHLLTLRLAVGGTAACFLLAIFALLRGTGDEETQLRSHLAAARASVHILGAIGANRAFHPVGTGWTVGDCKIATNCHVSGRLQALREEGARIVARTPGNPPRDVELLDIVEHPGWKRFEALMSTVVEGGASGYITMLGSFDVAVIKTAGTVGEPLELASTSEIESLRGGQLIGYVGFPMENMAGFQGNQPPTSAIGSVTAVHDFLGQTAAARFAALVQHDLPTAGGSSGSPLLNSAGHVIAVNNAGHYISLGGTRLPNVLRIGQRIDLLREVLDGTATARLDEYERYIVGELRAVGANAPNLLSGNCGAQLGVWRRNGEAPENVEPLIVIEQHDKAGKNASVSYTVNIQRGMRYVFVGCAADFSSCRLDVKFGDIAYESEERIGAKVAFVATATGTATVRVTAVSGQKDAPRLFVIGVGVPDLAAVAKRGGGR